MAIKDGDTGRIVIMKSHDKGHIKDVVERDKPLSKAVELIV